MDLSILIPSRNEMFLKNTVEDILKNKRGKTNIIVGLDGAWADPPLDDHPDVIILHYSESIGQRAMTNQLCRLSTAKYVMKVDAHCAFDEGFDVKMMDLMEDDMTTIPVMRNLHAFDWVCPDGHRRYQSPSGECKECGKPTERDVVWIAKTNPQSTAYVFDSEPHFQYNNAFGKAQTGDLTETMSIQGSCFMLTRDKYWELNICDESFGSWGSQGIEVAAKTWLSGGRVLCNRTTWYAHLFRTQGGDFSFPYPQSGTQVSRAKAKAKTYFDTWEGAKHPMSWLIERFWPVPGWTKEDLAKLKKEPTKGILYYSDNQLNIKLALKCRKLIADAGLPITSVTLKPTKFGRNIHYKGKRGYETMFKQILTGLEAMTQDIVYFCEHDVAYHPSHFNFTPESKNTWYYNGNYWSVREDGFAVRYDGLHLSGLVVYRETAIRHFRERVAMIEKDGFSYHMGFEPFTHKRVKWKFWCDYEVFQSDEPNVDMAHGGNATKKRWSQDEFVRKPKVWQEGRVEDLWLAKQV